MERVQTYIHTHKTSSISKHRGITSQKGNISLTDIKSVVRVCMHTQIWSYHIHIKEQVAAKRI